MTDANDKWQAIIETLELKLSKAQFSHFIGSTAIIECDSNLTVTLSRTANIQAIKHQLGDVLDRAIWPKFGSEIKVRYQLPFFKLPESTPPMLRDYDSEFSELMYSGAEDQDRVSYKRNFVKITGSINAAIILSDLEFWNQPNDKGNSKLRVSQDNEYWIARTNNEWQKLTGMTARQVRTAIEALVKLNLVIAKNYRFNGLKTQHLRINRTVFVELIKGNRYL